MAGNALPTSTLNLTIEKAPMGSSIVCCTGRITAETTGQLRETAKSLIKESKQVVLDLTGVNYLDSAGLGMIVGLAVSAKRSGSELRLVNLGPRVKEIFTILGLTSDSFF